MSDETTPLIPAAHGGLGDRVARWSLGAALRASLLVSPRPAALLVRKIFAGNSARVAEALERHVPADVSALLDQRYGDEPDMLLDVFRPAAATQPLPLLLWVHGGGFIAGTKEELAGYLKIIAHRGYVVAAPRYSLAPEHRYPTPPRQVMQALAYLQANAGRLLIDPARIALAGDSAGAHISAQLGALVTTPGYAGALNITPTITPAQLRCLVLACGPYDLGLARQSSSPVGAVFVKVVLWAYSGKRDYLDNPASATWSVTDNITAAFPPALITVGNADPLRPHSELLADELRAHAAEVETVFWPDDYQPPLGHEYQFDLDAAPGQQFLDRMLTFLGQRLAPPRQR
jgi:acetyl esterase/lipase